jgi:tRNA G37 N-methylase TrmD
MTIDEISLFREMLDAFMGTSIIAHARKKQ